MRRLLALSLIGLCAAGCERPAGKASPGGGGAAITHQQAMDLVNELPEVKAWAEAVQGRLGGNVVPVCSAEKTPQDCVAAGEPPHWIFYLGESHKTHRVLWNRFRVDAAGGAISVWDPFKGTYIPLDEWRNRFRAP